MNIIFISECDKRALKETRRILDQFAERKGRRTWQTSITQIGLDTVRQLLKKTARKNTAVACHRIGGKNHSELLWLVGDISKFSSQGSVPTNITRKDILKPNRENDWCTNEDIKLITKLAALFHDFGKSNSAFQFKLQSKIPVADPIRHEWISVRLFEAFIGESKKDEEWLARLINISNVNQNEWLNKMVCDPAEGYTPSPFNDNMPPLAKLIAWLIVSHHRLPMDSTKSRNTDPPDPRQLKNLPDGLPIGWCGKNNKEKIEQAAFGKCWIFKYGNPFNSRAWQNIASKAAAKLLTRLERKGCTAAELLDDSYVVHISRMILMLADHHYSSKHDCKYRKSGDQNYPIYANTYNNSYNQPLDEHLIGVSSCCSKIAHYLPKLETYLPHISRHRGFTKRTTMPNFLWQNKAYDLSTSIQEKSKELGFFGVNLASTGTGKTFANARIMYGLSDKNIGARFTVALGLRTLTIQTGESFRERLKLNKDELAVLIGEKASLELYDRLKQTQNSCNQTGSESLEDLLEEDSHVFYEGVIPEGSLKWLLKKNDRVSALVSAPVLCCTIDHLMPATESTRGGYQIAPMLRLLTSDLVLDEPDDFGIEDMYALSRLVNWAGMLGSRVLLSSATLPPSFVEGLFQAYWAGRMIFNKNRGRLNANSVCCAWFDEYNSIMSEVSGKTLEVSGIGGERYSAFYKRHNEFVSKRIQKLQVAPIRRKAAIKDVLGEVIKKQVKQKGDNSELLYSRYAETFLQYSIELHKDNFVIDPITKIKCSFSLIRMANIIPLISVALEILKRGTSDEYHIRLCCYHSQHPLVVRSKIEQRLDCLLKRNDNEAIFKDSEIRNILDNTQEVGNFLFIVLASPIAEIGRDHDYDFNISEPSSMRSFIQIGGRVKRHRSEPCKATNMYLLNENIKTMQGEEIAFNRPGFENKSFKLYEHHLQSIILPEQFETINSIPRIAERETTKSDKNVNLAELEHRRIQAIMLGSLNNFVFPAYLWWSTKVHFTGELQRATPFRYDGEPKIEYCLWANEEDKEISFKKVEDDGSLSGTSQNYLFKKMEIERGKNIDFWLADGMNFFDLIKNAAESCSIDIKVCSLKFARISLSGNSGTEFDYHPCLGFRKHKSK